MGVERRLRAMVDPSLVGTVSRFVQAQAEVKGVDAPPFIGLRAGMNALSRVKGRLLMRNNFMSAALLFYNRTAGGPYGDDGGAH